MNKITKAGVESTKFTVLDTNDAAAFSISASTPTETIIRAKEITINAEAITVPEVHVQNVLESADITIPFSLFASSIPIPLFPEAVGPVITITVFFIITSLQIFFLFHIYLSHTQLVYHEDK